MYIAGGMGIRGDVEALQYRYSELLKCADIE